MRVKINFEKQLNKTLDVISNLTQGITCPNCGDKIEFENYGVERELPAIEIGWKIVCEYLMEISERVCKIEDPILLECLLNLGMISGTEEEVKEIAENAEKIRQAEKEG